MSTLPCTQGGDTQENVIWKFCPRIQPLHNIPFLSEKVSLPHTFNGTAFGKIQSRSVLKGNLVHWLINVTWSHLIPHPSLSGKDHSTFGGRDGSFPSNVIRNKCKSPGKQPAFYNAITVSLQNDIWGASTEIWNLPYWWCVTTQILVGLPITYAVTTEILLQLLLQAAQCVPVTVIFNLLIKMHFIVILFLNYMLEMRCYLKYQNY